MNQKGTEKKMTPGKIDQNNEKKETYVLRTSAHLFLADTAAVGAIADLYKVVLLEHLVELDFCHAELTDVGVFVSHSGWAALLERGKN